MKLKESADDEKKKTNEKDAMTHIPCAITKNAEDDKCKMIEKLTNDNILCCANDDDFSASADVYVSNDRRNNDCTHEKTAGAVTEDEILLRCAELNCLLFDSYDMKSAPEMLVMQQDLPPIDHKDMMYECEYDLSVHELHSISDVPTIQLSTSDVLITRPIIDSDENQTNCVLPSIINYEPMKSQLQLKMMTYAYDEEPHDPINLFTFPDADDRSRKKLYFDEVLMRSLCKVKMKSKTLL